MEIYHEYLPSNLDEILSLKKEEVVLNIGLHDKMVDKTYNHHGYHDSGPIGMEENWLSNLNKFCKLVKRK